MIPFIKPYYDDFDFQAVKEVLNSGWVAQGPKVEEFEDAAAKYLGAKHCISTTNCTTALHLALMAMEIGPGDEVIVPDFTFPATALAVLAVGAKPVLADVDFYTYNVTYQAMEAVLTKKTKAIIPVHLFGLAADMWAIRSFAEKNQLLVIEDAACSLGTTVNFTNGKRKAGTIGDIGCFSFQASKGITTGEGGLICTNNDVYAERMRRFSSFGDERTYRRGKNGAPFHFDSKGLNYKMSDITAALALSQLRKIERLIDWRVKIAAEWERVISDDAFLRENIMSIPKWVGDHSHIYQSYVCVCRAGRRGAIMEYFKERGFSTGIGTHACSAYPATFGSADCSTARVLFENSISLPRYYGLEVEREWNK